MFEREHGVIIACDVDTIDELRNLVENTYDIEGIVGYKIGSILALRHGLSTVADKIRKHTDLPLIYDHQKLGADIPEICGEKIINICEEADVKAIIMFPFSGIETLKKAVKTCKEKKLTLIIGGEMTHKGYLRKEGGYLTSKAIERMYLDAAKLGVNHFVVPGTKPNRMRRYKTLLEDFIKEPSFFFPGIGKTYQGGDINNAFKAVRPYPSYAIVGRAIYMARDKREAAKKLCEVALSLMW